MRVTPLILIAVMVILASIVSVTAQFNTDINQTFGLNLTSVMQGRGYESEAGVDIDTELLKAFLLYNQTKVYVGIQLRDLSNITYEGASTDEQLREVWESQKAYFRNFSAEILENLSSDEFEAESTENRTLIRSLDGNITLKGLVELAQDYRIKFIAIPQGGGFAFPLNESQNQTLPYVDPAILPVFENQTWVEVFVKYSGDIPITYENEEEMFNYYQGNKTAVEHFFGYIPETEIRNVEGRLSALQPSFMAEVTKQGFDKLANDRRVTKIFPNARVQAQSNESQKEENNLTQNQIETKSPEIAKPKSLFQRIINFFKSLFRWK